MNDTVDCDIRQSLDRISSQMRRDYSESLRELNLYVGQENLLYRLWLGDGITQMQICKHLNCEPPTVTNMVKSLEQNGFIYRKRDEQDARVMRIHLTDKGKELEEPVVVVDTSNYYPQISGEIEEMKNGMVESVWVSNQLGRSIIKAFNKLLAYTLELEGTPEGSSERIATAVAGNDLQQKQIIMNMANELGFDTVDSGSLEDSWRQQPGTPAYCTELTKAELTEALKKADKEKAPYRRDKAIENLSAAAGRYSQKDIVNLNREIYNS